jgi:hypothetical protein
MANDLMEITLGESFNAGNNPPNIPGGWGTGSELGTLVAGSWTPGRNADGKVTLASVMALPANTWVRVVGTSLQTLKTKVEAPGKYLFQRDDWSSKDIRRTISAWVGCCMDGPRMIIPRGGGHADTFCNGTWELDFTKLVWDVLIPPRPSNVPGYEWDPDYRSTASSTNYREVDAGFVGSGTVIRADPEDGYYWDQLPAATPYEEPTSCHTYNGVWFDTKRRQFGTGRVSQWIGSVDEKKWVTRNRWSRLGKTNEQHFGEKKASWFTIMQNIFYHEAQDALYGFFADTGDLDTGDFFKCPLPGANMQKNIPSPGWTANAGQAVQLDKDRVLFFWFTGTAKVENAAIFNMATESWEKWGGSGWVPNNGTTLAVPVNNGEPYNTTFPGDSSGQVAMFIPSWGAMGQVIRHSAEGGVARGFWIYDIATHTNIETYTPAGDIPLPPANKSMNKWRHIPELGIAVAIDGRGTLPISSDCVYIMRYE